MIKFRRSEAVHLREKQYQNKQLPSKQKETPTGELLCSSAGQVHRHGQGLV